MTVEGFLSRKPVVTASDSGGPLEFVEDGASGFVAAPEPAALAEAIDRLWRLPETRLREMGEDAARRVASITWDDRRRPSDRARPVRVALWTPTPDAAWVAALRAELARELELTLVPTSRPCRPPAEIDLYHVAGSPAHGFVYRALLRRPGIVLLAEWGLHALVHAETAGRGDADAYLREARRAHGDTGEFVARQVLARARRGAARPSSR